MYSITKLMQMSIFLTCDWVWILFSSNGLLYKVFKYLRPSTYCVILNTPPNGHKQTQTWLSNSCNLVGLWPKFYFDVAGHCIKKSL